MRGNKPRTKQNQPTLMTAMTAATTTQQQTPTKRRRTTNRSKRKSRRRQEGRSITRMQMMTITPIGTENKVKNKSKSKNMNRPKSNQARPKRMKTAKGIRKTPLQRRTKREAKTFLAKTSHTKSQSSLPQA